MTHIDNVMGGFDFFLNTCDCFWYYFALEYVWDISRTEVDNLREEIGEIN